MWSAVAPGSELLMATGSKLGQGTKVVAAAGTPVPLESPDAEGSALSVVIQALYTNEGRIVIGGEKVKAEEGTHASPKQAGIALEKGQFASFDVVDAAAIFIDATKSGDGVAYTVLYP
jgi:hypothetical protein